MPGLLVGWCICVCEYETIFGYCECFVYMFIALYHSVCVCTWSLQRWDIVYSSKKMESVLGSVLLPLFSLLLFFRALYGVWLRIMLGILYFLIFLGVPLIVSWVFFVLFNIIYVCFDKSCAVRVHDEWIFTNSICFYKYVQATTKGEEGMILFFVCCNPNYGHRWRDWESKFWW